MNHLVHLLTGYDTILCPIHFSPSLGIVLGCSSDACHQCQREETLKRNADIASHPMLQFISTSDIVYLSGPMSGISGFNRQLFHYWEGIIKCVCACQVLSPAHWPEGLTYEDYMKKDIALVLGSTVMIMLPDWRKSRGANAERHVALVTGLTIYYLWEHPIVVDFIKSSVEHVVVRRPHG